MENHLYRVTATLVSGEEDIIKESFQEALNAGIIISQLREVILTSYLFDGYPTALEGYRILFELVGYQSIDKTDLTYNPVSIESWRKRGEPLCRTIYGPQYELLMKRVMQIAPELSDAMIVEGYGKVLSRDGLEPRVRELCVVTILAVKYKPRQLLSHTLGALRLGATPEHLLYLLDVISEITPNGNINKAHKIIEEAISKYSLPL
ncbi:MAG: carboxymuconolactone decarboxylase family protein [Candidatus Hatepunaea meridiana]|nr:carboxymuconolactone decarboxylase family protein [Candidatus Hatepunaea meridiana]